MSDTGPGAGRVDLHVHTSASDGLHRPAEVVELAAEAGLSAVAVTDHDTVAGIEEATEVGRRLAVEVVGGVELTAYAGPAEVHIVGLFVDVVAGTAPGRLGEAREARRARMERMLARLASAGVRVAMNDVEETAEGAPLGRPHLARAMARLGLVAGVQEAYDRYIGDGRPAFERKLRMSPEEAIALVHAMGGLAVLAHPATCRIDERLAELRRAGLDAVEVWHSKHSFADERHYARLAARRGLLPSGGSDFHGAELTEARLGVPEVGAGVLEALRALHASGAGVLVARSSRLASRKP